jgi:hypothetical protein
MPEGRLAVRELAEHRSQRLKRAPQRLRLGGVKQNAQFLDSEQCFRRDKADTIKRRRALQRYMTRAGSLDRLRHRWLDNRIVLFDQTTSRLARHRRADGQAIGSRRAPELPRDVASGRGSYTLRYASD